MHNTNCPIVRSVALYLLVIRENKRKVAGWSLSKDFNCKPLYANLKADETRDADADATTATPQ